MPKKSVKKIKKIKIAKPVKQKKILPGEKKKIKPVKKVLKKKKIVTKKKNLRHSSGQEKNIAKQKKIVKIKKIAKPKKIGAKKKKIEKPKKEIKAKKAVKHKTKKTEPKLPIKDFPAESLFKARIKVIGIGGGGSSIVSEIGRSLDKATFVVADTDIRALKKKSGIKYFWFGQELTHGLGTGVNVDLARQAAESAKEKISGTFKDQDIIIFIASLGGGLGSGATQIFADAAREFGGITFGIFTMPFKFEGKNKQRIAQTALKSLRQTLNVSLVIPNEKIFKIIDANTPITDAFSIVNKSLIESLESLIDLIYNPGIINIDFADLRAILKGRGNSAFLNTSEESGKDRAEKICQKILANPLLQTSGFEAEKILFNVAGSENLSMFEVEKISSHISGLNPKAKIIFGISKSPKLKNKIKTTILMTGGEVEEELVAEAELVKIVVPEIVEKQAVREVKEEKKLVIKKEKKKVEKPIKKPAKKEKIKKPSRKVQDKPETKGPKEHFEEKPISFIPVFEAPIPPVSIVESSRMNIVDAVSDSSKKITRRSGLEIKRAEELQEKKRIEQEKEWEIPAFLRKIKYKS